MATKKSPKKKNVFVFIVESDFLHRKYHAKIFKYFKMNALALLNMAEFSNFVKTVDQ
ncbi:hypothetical protein FGF1_08420 [Flavobacteriaceae bacterium GF1]